MNVGFTIGWDEKRHPGRFVLQKDPKEALPMKRILALLMAALLLGVVCGTVTRAENLIPAEIQNRLAKEEIRDAAHLSGHGINDRWFVLVRTAKGRNVLHCFKYRNDRGWVPDFHTESAVPQGPQRVTIFLTDEMQDWRTDRRVAGPLLVIEQLNAEEEYPELFTAYQLSASGQWNLRSLWSYTGYDSMDLYDGRIVYYQSLESSRAAGTVYGVYQRDLRFVNLSAIPKTLAAAQKKMTTAPELPYSEELQAQVIQFTGGKKYEVRTAPDKTSIRGGNGKAAVSTNGWIQVFGREGGWILIQYSIDAGRYRFGYISADALPKTAEVPELRFSATPARTVRSVFVTDDPLFSQGAFNSLTEGWPVTWLATLGDWAYIEAAGFRGFVPVSALAAEASPAASRTFAACTGQDGRTYDLFEITKLHYDSTHRVTAVTGRYARVAEGEDCYHSEYADETQTFTYLLAADFRAEMIGSMVSESMENVPVTDLYDWYTHVYLEEPPASGNLVFLCDIPAGKRDDAVVDFWFVTTRIALNERNEIAFMEYVYVPWA